MADEPQTNTDAREAKAGSRFALISLMRLGGALMVVAGIAVLQNVLPLPLWTAYLLLVLGLAELFIVPRMLAKMWNTNDRNPPSP